jgi:hypothetical protein
VYLILNLCQFCLKRWATGLYGCGASRVIGWRPAGSRDGTNASGRSIQSSATGPLSFLPPPPASTSLHLSVSNALPPLTSTLPNLTKCTDCARYSNAALSRFVHLLSCLPWLRRFKSAPEICGGCEETARACTSSEYCGCSFGSPERRSRDGDHPTRFGERS